MDSENGNKSFGDMDVTSIFLLKNLSTLPRAVALRPCEASLLTLFLGWMFFEIRRDSEFCPQEDPLWGKVKHFGRPFCVSSSSRQCLPSVYGDKRELGSLICLQISFFWNMFLLFRCPCVISARVPFCEKHSSVVGCHFVI